MNENNENIREPNLLSKEDFLERIQILEKEAERRKAIFGGFPKKLAFWGGVISMAVSLFIGIFLVFKEEYILLIPAGLIFLNGAAALIGSFADGLKHAVFAAATGILALWIPGMAVLLFQNTDFVEEGYVLQIALLPALFIVSLYVYNRQMLEYPADRLKKNISIILGFIVCIFAAAMDLGVMYLITIFPSDVNAMFLFETRVAGLVLLSIAGVALFLMALFSLIADFMKSKKDFIEIFRRRAVLAGNLFFLAMLALFAVTLFPLLSNCALLWIMPNDALGLVATYMLTLIAAPLLWMSALYFTPYLRFRKWQKQAETEITRMKIEISD